MAVAAVAPRVPAATSTPALREPPTPCRQQKWLEQLCQVESRLLANWQEFAENKQDVQLQLQDIQEQLQRLLSTEAVSRRGSQNLSSRLESELDRCQRRVQQVAESQEEMAGRVGDLRSSVDGSREAIDSLRTRISDKLQEMGSAIEEQQSSVSSTNESLLREALDAAKRTSRTVAEELLRKMEDMNGKIWESMSSMEEQSSWALQRLQQDVKELTSRADAVSTSSEGELRKLEARLEGSVRTRLGELQAQVLEVSDHSSRLARESNAEAMRLSKMDGHLQEHLAQAEAVQAALKQTMQRADATKVQIDELRTLNAEQFGRVREEMSGLIQDQQRNLRESLEAHVAGSQERIRQLREEFSGYVDEANARSENRTEALRSTVISQEADIMKQVVVLQTDVGSLEQLVDQRHEQVVGAHKHAEAAHETVRKLQQSVQQDLAEHSQQFHAKCEENMEAAMKELQRHGEKNQQQLADHQNRHQAERLEHAEMIMHQKSSLAEHSQGAAEIKRRLEASEQAHKNHKEVGEQREERRRTAEQGLLDQIAQTREEIMKTHRDRADKMEQATHDSHRHHGGQLEALEAAKEQAAKEQASMGAKLEAYVQEAIRSAEDSKHHSRAHYEDTMAKTEATAMQLKERLEAALLEERKAHEAVRGEHGRRFEAVERLQAEHAARSRDRMREMQQQLQDRHDEALRAYAEEQRGRIEHASHTGVEVTEKLAKITAQHTDLRAELGKDVEAVRRATMQHFEEKLAKTEAKLEAAGAISSKGLAELHEQVLAHSSSMAQQLQAFVPRDHFNSETAKLKDVVGRGHSDHEAFAKEIRNATQAVEEARGRDMRQLREHVNAVQNDVLGKVDGTAKERETQLLARIAALSHEAADAHRSLEDGLKQHKELLSERIAEAKAGIEEQLHRHHAKALDQVEQAKSHFAEHHKKQADSHADALEQATAHLKAYADGSHDRATEKALDSHRKLELSTEDRFNKGVQTLYQDVSELKNSHNTFAERFKGHQDSVVDQHQKLSDLHHKADERLSKQLRDMAQVHAELQVVTRSHMERTAANQKQHEESLSRSQQERWSVFSDQHSHQLAQLGDHLAEARETLSEQVRSTKEHALEEVQHAKDATAELGVRLLSKAEEQQRAMEAALRATEMETSRAHEAQMQDVRQALHSRCSDGESRLEALRQQLEQQVASHARRHGDDLGALSTKSQALEDRLKQERERLDSVIEAQSRQTDKHLEAAMQRLLVTQAEVEDRLKRTLEANWVAANDGLDQLRARLKDTEADAKAKGEETTTKFGHLQARVAELKAEYSALAIASAQREETLSAEIERRSRAAREDVHKVEAQVVQTNSATQRTLEVLEQRLVSHVNTSMATMTGKDKHDEAHAETHLRIAKAEDSWRANESRCAELHSRFDKTDEHIKKQAQFWMEDAEKRAKKHAESFEAHKKQTQDHMEVTRKRTAEMQQGVDAVLQQKSADTLSLVKSAMNEGQQRSQREAADAAAEFRQRTDEASERHASELREIQISIHAKMHETQAELQRQMGVDRQAAQALVAESKSFAEDRLRESIAVNDRERSRVESQTTNKVEELQRGLRREFGEAVQHAEAVAADSLERDVEKTNQAVDELRRSTTSTIHTAMENIDRRVKEVSEMACKTSTELSDQHRVGSEELRGLFQQRAKALEERLNELMEHVTIVDRDLRQVSGEEIPVLARKVASGQQTQGAHIEDLKKAHAEKHAALSRKAHADGDSLAQLTQQVVDHQRDVAAKHKDIDQRFACSQKDVCDDLKAVKDELHAVLKAESAALRSAHHEFKHASHQQKERHSGALEHAVQQHDTMAGKMGKKIEELEGATTQARILSVCAETIDGLVRSVTTQELQLFQREALDSVEWKLERCIQWLHGANVKLGLNPAGTLFSVDKFREMLFDHEALGQPYAKDHTPRSASPARPQRRASSATSKSTGAMGRR